MLTLISLQGGAKKEKMGRRKESKAKEIAAPTERKRN
jgi:hypothetical protein